MKRSISKLRILLFIALPALAASCCGEKTVTIISTNDIHGGIDRFPSLATLVKEYRATDSARLLLIDAGDRWTGNPYVDLAEKRGYPIIELMNALGYQAATLGNHEFDRGQALLQERIEESRFPNLVANMRSSDSARLRALPPYKIFDVDGVRIALLGLLTTYPNGHPVGKDELFTGLAFPDPEPTALSYKNLRDSSDLFVALTHIGVESDSLLATRMPELDLIIGGHSHTVLPDGGKPVNGVLVTQTGKGLKYAGITTVTLRCGKVKKIDNRLVRLDTVAPDPEFAAMVETYKSAPALQKSVGSTRTDLLKEDLAGIFGDVMRRAAGAQFSFYNLGGVRVDTLPAGPVTVAEVFGMEPFGSTVYTLEMTGDQLRELLLNKFNSEGNESHSIDLYPSGLDYTVLMDDAGEGVDVLFTPHLTPGKKYKVALSDYVQGAYDYSLRGTASPTDLILTDLLTDYFGKNDPIVKTAPRRGHIAKRNTDEQSQKRGA